MSTEILVVIGIVAILFYGGLIWFSVRAKRLGPKPYRWATYIAITSALGGLSLGLSSVTPIKNGYLTGAATLVFMSASFVACAVGLFQRRKYGVIAFLVGYLGLWFTNILHNHTPQEQSQSAVLFIYIIITAIYLLKRWKFLSSPVDNSEPPLADKAISGS